MILDSSAVLAVVLGQPGAESILATMATADELAISAATLVETLIVAEVKQGPDAAFDVHALLADLEVDVVPLDEAGALAAAQGWQRFGQGRHGAALNFGDLLAYGLAKATLQPLLFTGDAFRATDLPSAR